MVPDCGCMRSPWGARLSRAHKRQREAEEAFQLAVAEARKAYREEWT